MALGSALVIECQWEMGSALYTQTLSLPSLLSFCSLGFVWVSEGLFAFPVLYVNSNLRKGDQLCGWNSNLVWVFA